MHNKPDFEHAELLVAEIMHHFPRRKPMSDRALTNRFHKRYGKRCSDWMVRRGIAALLDRIQPGWREKAATFEQPYESPKSTRS